MNLKHAPLVILITTLLYAMLSANTQSAVLFAVASALFMLQTFLDFRSDPEILPTLQKRLDDLETESKKREEKNTEITRLAEETKRLLSQTNVGVAFRPKIIK